MPHLWQRHDMLSKLSVLGSLLELDRQVPGFVLMHAKQSRSQVNSRQESKVCTTVCLTFSQRRPFLLNGRRVNLSLLAVERGDIFRYIACLLSAERKTRHFGVWIQQKCGGLF